MTAILDHLLAQFLPVILVVAGYCLLLLIAYLTSKDEQ